LTQADTSSASEIVLVLAPVGRDADVAFPPCEPPGLLPSHARVGPRFMSVSERREILSVHCC
jgi:hypothetical protein